MEFILRLFHILDNSHNSNNNSNSNNNQANSNGNSSNTANELNVNALRHHNGSFMPQNNAGNEPEIQNLIES